MKNIILVALLLATTTTTTACTPEEACFGEPCTGACAPGLVCEPHPDNASLAVCAAPCCIGQPCAVEADGCGEPLAGECRDSFLGAPLCFPVIVDQPLH